MSALLEISRLVKDYRALRPLRIEHLSIAPAEHLAVIGLDAPAAEMLVNIVTGAVLPDAGAVSIFGRTTAEISDSSEWLSVVDRFGIVTERAVLLERLSTLQNLALPFSLEIEPPSEELRHQAIALAREVGLAESAWDRPVASLDAAGRARLRLGRALALQPSVLLLEHPTAAIERHSVAALARDVRDAATSRGLAVLALTGDVEFASAVAARVLTLEPASGRLSERRRRWFR